MKRADLEKLGLNVEALEKAELSKDVIDQIMELHGKGVQSHKTAAETAQSEAQALQEQIAEANKKIDSFKDLDVDSIKQEADNWKVKAQEAEENHKKAVASLKFDHALSDALVSAKVKNTKAVVALLNRDDLKLSEADGKIIGLDDQLQAIRESDDYLFISDDKKPRIVGASSNQSVVSDSVVAAVRQAAGLTGDTKG
jgi:hypothetical protein